MKRELLLLATVFVVASGTVAGILSVGLAKSVFELHYASLNCAKPQAGGDNANVVGRNQH